MATSTSRPLPTFEQFAAARRYQPALAFSPDGEQIAYSANTTGQFNLWRQPSAGGYAEQLTSFANQTVRDIAWSPDGRTIAFTADLDGNEQYQLHTVASEQGWPEAIASEPDVQHFLGLWSEDGRAFAYAANDREPTEQDILLRDVESGEVKRLLAGAGNFFPGPWSPDGTQFLAVEANFNTDHNIYLVSINGDEPRNLTEHDGDVQNLPVAWAPDGSGFYLITDEGREFTGIAFQDLASGSRRWVEAPEADITFAELSKDGRVLVWVANESGYDRLYARDLVTNEVVPTPKLPAGVVGGLVLSRDGWKAGMLLSTSTHPMEAYVVDLAAGVANRITNGFLGGIDESTLIEPELISFPTFDGKKIPAFLYMPRGDGPFGVVLSIHGGPEAQERPDYNYNGLYQYWLSRGIGVLAPNVRGSTGYGKTYQSLIHRDFGGDDLKDFEAAAKYAQALPWVDSNKLGVFGGSYGGFATLSCVSRLPNYWAAAVDIVGPSNLVTLAQSVPPTWRRYMAKWVGDPETEADFLLSRSPVTYADQIVAPLFVIQGANDPRVKQAESDQIVERLRSRGVDVRYDVYDDEGHGFTKRTNELKAIKDTAEFMERYLA